MMLGCLAGREENEMKKIPVVLLAAITLAVTGLAEAAPKKRTRNADRIGPYGMGAVGQSHWTGDQSGAEAFVLEQFTDNDVPAEDVSIKTEENDLGYNFTVGYRFKRYFAAEIGLAQYGSVASTGRADVDTSQGIVPVSVKLAFSAGGPLISAIGIVPVNDTFELFGRVGYLFTSSEREIVQRVDGQASGFGNAKGDSQDLVLGVGAAYNVNQMYAMRLEYQKLTLGESENTGEEDVNVISLGLVVRF
jgi:opacity protein-like surface antigen